MANLHIFDIKEGIEAYKRNTQKQKKERKNIVGICVMKWCGADVELETFHYKGQSYCLSAYYGNVLHPERKWVTVSRIPLTDIVLWEQIYNCLCREYEEVIHKH